jgi:hypothetical protein
MADYSFGAPGWFEAANVFLSIILAGFLLPLLIALVKVIFSEFKGGYSVDYDALDRSVDLMVQQLREKHKEKHKNDTLFADDEYESFEALLAEKPKRKIKNDELS